MNEKALNQQLSEEDIQFNVTLRPQDFADFVGQEKLRERLEIFISAARKRGEPLEHMLFCGPPGLGKTTLANLIARQMGANLKTTSGPVIEKAGDLAGLLTNLEEGDILFIDEIHRLNHVVEEYLYPAMEDFSLDIIIDKGPSARSIRLNLAKFTLVGATTRSGLLTAPLRSRFGFNSRLDYYPALDLKQILLRSARILNVEINEEGAFEIARRSRGTPRIANILLRRVRDFVQVKTQHNQITQDLAHEALTLLDVDEKGLDEMDKRILLTLIEKFSGGPVGIQSLSVAVGEEPGTIEEVYEPFLIQQGFLQRTPSGRKASALAYAHFNLKIPASLQPEKQEELF